MLKKYFEIIRKALNEGRKKGDIYYEAHHITPKCFKKKSKLVLLTPEEHYECHKLLAEVFKGHSVYGQKMLWAFHRLAYDKKRKLTAEQYGEARRILMFLWKRERTKETKQKISEKLKGNKNNKSRVFKGMKSNMTLEGRERLAELRKSEQTGGLGDSAKASKGIVVYENTATGEKVEAGSALQLSYLVGLSPATISFNVRGLYSKRKKSWKVYYKILS